MEIEQSTGTRFLKSALSLLGRVLISSVFIFSALDRTLDWTGALAFVSVETAPLPDYIVVVGISIAVIGALLVFVGFKTRLGANLLLFYYIIITFLFHHFWDLDATSQQLQIVLFIKNIAIMGGLLYIIAYGAGRWSVDGALKRRRE